MYIFISLYISVCGPFTYWAKTEFILTSLPQVHCHMDHSNLFLLLICTLPLQQWKNLRPPIIHVPNCSVPASVHSNIRPDNLHPVKNNFIQLIVVLMNNFFCLYFYRLLISRITRASTFFSRFPFKRVILYICDIVRWFYHNLYFIKLRYCGIP